METSTTLNIIGLSLDIIGVVLLFFYEPPKPEIGALLLHSAPTEAERNKVKAAKRKFSSIGLISLIIGFSFQIISNFY
ncbi:hypothetical protein GCM10011506_38590 [Marivirga lumbricoides]|uniref:Uncharacterized protein n=1 Tax=Marivirga lumbricoides TaxID=1046115 RepID=A0ABQ1N1S9_9BACT|nr:hypothetical protein GCM10011506_38590 [Marivirga lumbricoides]